MKIFFKESNKKILLDEWLLLYLNNLKSNFLLSIEEFSYFQINILQILVMLIKIELSMFLKMSI